MVVELGGGHSTDFRSLFLRSPVDTLELAGACRMALGHQEGQHVLLALLVLLGKVVDAIVPGMDYSALLARTGETEGGHNHMHGPDSRLGHGLVGTLELDQLFFWGEFLGR